MAIIGLRNKPLNPCIIQYQLDDGTWVDCPDMGCCGGNVGGGCVPPLRVSGGNVQSYDPATGKWNDTAPGETPKLRVAKNTVYFDKSHPSVLILPVVAP